MDRIEFDSVSPNVNDIESRIIILKRRAAEAEFLREERDMLLNRLKLYSNDYILPEVQNVDKLKEENEYLLEQIKELQETVKCLEEDVSEVGRLKQELKLLTLENNALKENLAKLKVLEDEVDKLLCDKNQLKADFDNAIAVVSSEDPIGKCKEQIRSLYERAQNLRNERDYLQEQLIEKEVKIDVLQGKISHLNARLNEKLLSARFKAKQGLQLSPEEDLILTISRLEAANRTMGLEIVELTTKLNAALRGVTTTPRVQSVTVDEEEYKIRKFNANEQISLKEEVGFRPVHWVVEGLRLEERSSGFLDKDISSDHFETTDTMEAQLARIKKNKDSVDQYHKKLCSLRTDLYETKDINPFFTYNPSHAALGVYHRTESSILRGSVL